MEDLYPIAVGFRFFVPDCGFSHEFGLNSSLEMLARSKQRERDENNKRSSSSFNSVPETFDSNENTPQNSPSELTPEVAAYCGALQCD